VHLRRAPIVDTSEIITDVDSDRTALESLKPGDWAHLKREPGNHGHRNAVLLFDGMGRRLGHISPALTKSVRARMAAGWRNWCLISQAVTMESGEAPKASVIVFCYDARDEYRVGPALVDLSTRIRRGMHHHLYIAVPSPKRRGSFHGLAVSIDVVEEPAPVTEGVKSGWPLRGSRSAYAPSAEQAGRANVSNDACSGGTVPPN
jgi:hypothetical protein